MKEFSYIIRFLILFAATLLVLIGCSSDFDEVQTKSITREKKPSNQSESLILELGLMREVEVRDSLNHVSDITQPHQTKDLRKQIVRLRDVLDLFAHHFAHCIEMWSEVRRGLDDGYFVVGEFKDLFDTDPLAVSALKNGQIPTYRNMQIVKKRRDEVMVWKKNYFSEKGLRKKIIELFSEIKKPNANQIENSKKYSKFFWGGLSATPSPDNHPAENARILVDAQSEIVRDEHAKFLEIKNPTTKKNEIIFHDHRKRLRTIVKVCQVANQFEKETCNSSVVGSIEALVSDLGQIEDLIVTGRHLENDDKKADAIDAYKKANIKFEKLKTRFDGRSMIEALDHL